MLNKLRHTAYSIQEVANGLIQIVDTIIVIPFYL